MENTTVLFRFDIHITDEDYLDFNRFLLLKSPYGKKQLLSLRLCLVAVAVSFSLLVLFLNGFSGSSFWTVALLWLITVCSLITCPRALLRTVKRNIKSKKKREKTLFTPTAVLEFYEDRLVETTDDGKLEIKYTAIDSISVISDTTVYLHINEMGAFLMPPSTFLSHETYRQFVAFLKAKNNNVHCFSLN